MYVRAVWPVNSVTVITQDYESSDMASNPRYFRTPTYVCAVWPVSSVAVITRDSESYDQSSNPMLLSCTYVYVHHVAH